VRLRSRLKIENTIPLASMADIAFLLIIFFMLTSTFAKDIGLDVSLPKAKSTDILPKREVNIWVTNKGEFYVDRKPVPPSQLADAINAALDKTSLKVATIRGDQGVPYGTIVHVMDIVKLSGAGITLAARIEHWWRASSYRFSYTWWLSRPFRSCVRKLGSYLSYKSCPRRRSSSSKLSSPSPSRSQSPR